MRAMEGNTLPCVAILLLCTSIISAFPGRLSFNEYRVRREATTPEFHHDLPPLPLEHDASHAAYTGPDGASHGGASQDGHYVMPAETHQDQNPSHGPGLDGNVMSEVHVDHVAAESGHAPDASMHESSYHHGDSGVVPDATAHESPAAHHTEGQGHTEGHADIPVAMAMTGGDSGAEKAPVAMAQAQAQGKGCFVKMPFTCEKY